MLITLHNVKIRMSNVATEKTTRKFNSKIRIEWKFVLNKFFVNFL